MYRRALALSVVAVLGALGGAGLSAAAVAVPVSASVSSVAQVIVVDPAASAVTSGAEEDQSQDGAGTQTPKDPVAERSSAKGTPVIMVTGLAVLLAAILMVVRSGSTRRVEEE